METQWLASNNRNRNTYERQGVTGFRFVKLSFFRQLVPFPSTFLLDGRVLAAVASAFLRLTLITVSFRGRRGADAATGGVVDFITYY